MFIEIVAVGFLGIASVLFKEKQMGAIRVHAIMPLPKSLFLCSKIVLFLLTDLIFAALMVLLNVGLNGVAVLPAVLIQTAILSLIMALAGFGCTMILKDFKQFSLAYLVIALFAATPVFLAANTSVKMEWIDYHPFYHVYMGLKMLFSAAQPPAQCITWVPSVRFCYFLSLWKQHFVRKWEGRGKDERAYVSVKKRSER